MNCLFGTRYFLYNMLSFHLIFLSVLVFGFITFATLLLKSDEEGTVAVGKIFSIMGIMPSVLSVLIFVHVHHFFRNSMVRIAFVTMILFLHFVQHQEHSSIQRLNTKREELLSLLKKVNENQILASKSFERGKKLEIGLRLVKENTQLLQKEFQMKFQKLRIRWKKDFQEELEKFALQHREFDDRVSNIKKEMEFKVNQKISKYLNTTSEMLKDLKQQHVDLGQRRIHMEKEIGNLSLKIQSNNYQPEAKFLVQRAPLETKINLLEMKYQSVSFESLSNRSISIHSEGKRRVQRKESERKKQYFLLIEDNLLLYEESELRFPVEVVKLFGIRNLQLSHYKGYPRLTFIPGRDFIGGDGSIYFKTLATAEDWYRKILPYTTSGQEYGISPIQ